MERKTRFTMGGVIIGLALMGGLIYGGIFLAQQKPAEGEESVTEIKTIDACGRQWLPEIHRKIEQYQKEHGGANPENLAILYEQYGLRQVACEYIYRGADLTAGAAAAMILAYDKAGNHEGYRHVLQAGVVKEYFVTVQAFSGLR